MKCKPQREKESLFTFPFPGIWLSRLNTCEKRVLQGHPRMQIVPGCLGDCMPLMQWLVASSSLARLAARSRAFTCRCCHGKGHLEEIQATLEGKSENESWEKIEADSRRYLSGSNRPLHNSHCQGRYQPHLSPPNSRGSPSPGNLVRKLLFKVKIKKKKKIQQRFIVSTLQNLFCS